MLENVLVTGGAGYVGAPLVYMLLNNNYNVIVMDNLAFGGEALLGVWHHPGFRFVKADITSPDSVKTVLSEHKIDAIVHLAAIVGDPACSKQPELAKKVNWEASVNLYEMAMKSGVHKFIFASTCSNYGKMKDSDGWVDESSALKPVSLYAELKVKFENMILNESGKINDFCPTILRFSTVYGISQRMRFDLTVNEFTKEVALGRELKIFGEQFWRPYCHVKDFSEAIRIVMTSPDEKVAYNVFNVGATEENYQKKMIADELIKLIPDAKISYVKKDDDPRDYRVSFKKIESELGFKVSLKLPDGIREIRDLIRQKVLLDPDDPKYRNS